MKSRVIARSSAKSLSLGEYSSLVPAIDSWRSWQRVTCFRVYTSIERCKITPSGDVEWMMATASDAKGNLPMAVQKLGVPGAIVNDVGFFIKWIAEQRASAGAS